ncbi:cell wall hydrolase [Pontixanthobacter aestiaquae]|uniref:Cell wall hydrolase n=1 Tax=Pontixanthobacter aestiaquae TaxID=1509367 RepID=A0A844Z8A4_9SPHN|nr:cell wall hydrolase [Pontixanthobacter aestiaquae]MDN3646879.1 cell wall hydrolase [Pontixanthobacter aestiaquae]MXO82139.1 cell wall hydrolase [Pontixanthobacter aestiaquae]
MARKTHFAGAVTFVTALGFTFASAELSGANAQQGVETEVTASTPVPALTDETVPVFVSEPVVQPLPEAEEAEETATDAPQASSLRELVRITDTSADLSREMECLAGTVYFESRGEPLAGQLAVAQVVINRAESSRFPSSYCGVVYQRSQFSFVKGGKMPRITRSSTAWKRAKAIARIAHEGHWDSEARDSLYFHATYVRPSWSYRKAKRAAISTHIFYR